MSLPVPLAWCSPLGPGPAVSERGQCVASPTYQDQQFADEDGVLVVEMLLVEVAFTDRLKVNAIGRAEDSAGLVPVDVKPGSSPSVVVSFDQAADRSYKIVKRRHWSRCWA